MEQMTRTRSPKEIAMDIHKGSDDKRELEKMFGCSFEEMTVEQRRLGVAALSAAEELLADKAGE